MRQLALGLAALAFACSSASAEDLHIRVEFDGGVRRDILRLDRAGDDVRIRCGSADAKADPEAWEESKPAPEAVEALEKTLAAEKAWELASDEAEPPAREAVTAWVPACRITLEGADGRRVTAVRRPFQIGEDTPFGRIARAAQRALRPAPAGTGIEFSFRIPITDNGYTMRLERTGDKARLRVRPHHPTGELADPVEMDVPADEFAAAWAKAEESGAWSLGDVNAAGADGERYDVRLWKDGAEHRFRIFQPQAVGSQPHKFVVAALLNLKGGKGLRDVALERFRAMLLRQRVERLYRDWAGGAEKLRDDAERALVEMGAPAVPVFREMLALEKSKDVIARGDALIERMQRR